LIVRHRRRPIGKVRDAVNVEKLTGTDLVLNARVLSFCVFTDENGVDIIIRCLISGNGDTWPDVGEKVESPSESQVERNVTLSDYPATISEQA